MLEPQNCHLQSRGIKNGFTYTGDSTMQQQNNGVGPTKNIFAKLYILYILEAPVVVKSAYIHRLA